MTAIKLRDNPRDWGWGRTSAPPEVDRKAFQAKLDALCGKARGGQSIIRLVWGAEEEVKRFDPEQPLNHDLMKPKYQTRIRGKKTKVRINRWIIEEFQPPEQLDTHIPWVRTNQGVFVPPQILHEQEVGRYQLLYVISDHDKCPADICNSVEYFCFGDYRAPSKVDLVKLQRAQDKRNHGKRFNPYEPLPQNVIDHWHSQGLKGALNENEGE